MQSTVWSESAARCLSKSYMALPVAVVAVEVAGHVLVHGRLDRHEPGIIARVAQMFDACFSEILILRANCLRHLDIFDIHWPAKRFEHGADHVTEALSLAGANVKDAVDPSCIQQPAQDGNGVIHVNEITALVAIGYVVSMRLEQAH